MLEFTRVGSKVQKIKNNVLEEFTGNTESELKGTCWHVQSVKTPSAFKSKRYEKLSGCFIDVKCGRERNVTRHLFSHFRFPGCLQEEHHVD
jgi:hypothetical protein